ncbi:NAD(P)-dependent oxidoreductase [Pseudomonas daroniae]|uniref:NAD(P)-dependent oxidoreductase n=1 Tax=Phytopseudomonas daroniae TaxID=2487519 RepID=A0A4Q9QIA6_9GAMM|nr:MULTISPECIES: SAF domain-containing protein [Pseudomonas]TBU75736.1 NAD(P)-dependent oxidoreductase [Pseudomonas daroniae]TBU80531.1 NAD(P)-dependent oxidoreductase [Pseudomonas sp. FRB 228]TBU89644.1 NAD(P)-dependent oxidoreductase [Pseudomonas daroniae]
MIIVDTALAKCEAEGRPIRVGMIGAGFQGSGIGLQILTATTGMRLCAVANRTIGSAVGVYDQAGIEPLRCDTQAELERAIAAGTPAVTEDALALARAEGLDAIIEVTGSIEYAAGAVLAALEAGKHVVQMNAELDGTIGPILKHKADQAGVIYTFSDGDQPGVQMNLYRFVAGLGITPVLCGNIKGLHDPYRNPTTQQEFARRWGQKAAMVASFADGTKISFEQAIVANATGMRVARRGMLGPDFSGGNPGAPLVPIEDTLCAFEAHLSADEPGLVDYVVGARPGPGVFVIGTLENPRQRHYLELYKLGKGPYYSFYTPYHLCHFEVPNSVARAVLFGDPVLTPSGGPSVGVIAVAKKDLRPGDSIDDFGGYETYGVAENIAAIRDENLLPIGLALGCTLKRAVAKDTPLTFDDVQFPRGRIVDRLYAEQECLFAPHAAGTQRFGDFLSQESA